MVDDENGVIFDSDFLPLYWYTHEDASPTLIPDNRPFSEVLWELKDELYGFAHTHPFGEMTQPSLIDLTTFQAIEQGLGKRLLWPIVTPKQSELYFFHKKIDLNNNEYKSVNVKLTFKQMLNKRALFNELRNRGQHNYVLRKIDN